MYAARRFSCPSFFHPSTKRRMYKLLSNGLIGAPCGVPRPSSRLRVLRCLFPFSLVSSPDLSAPSSAKAATPPPYGLRSIRSTFQLLRQFVQPLLHPILFDVLEGLAIYSCCSAIGFATFIGECQNVFSVHLVVQDIEAKVGRSLRFVVQRRLQLLTTQWSC